MARSDDDFAEFARASYGGLKHAAYLLTGDRHTAEDAAQTALVRTYAAWSRVRRDDAAGVPSATGSPPAATPTASPARTS